MHLFAFGYMKPKSIWIWPQKIGSGEFVIIYRQQQKNRMRVPVNAALKRICDCSPNQIWCSYTHGQCFFRILAAAWLTTWPIMLVIYVIGHALYLHVYAQITGAVYGHLCRVMVTRPTTWLCTLDLFGFSSCVIRHMTTFTSHDRTYNCFK